MELQLETTIKSEVEGVFGRRIVTSRDCVQLSHAIFHKTGHQLNHNTLRRFFGLVKAPYASSKTTLGILSKYCGYHCVSEVAKPPVSEEPLSAVHADGMLSFMVSLFRDVPVYNRDDRTFISLVYNTVGFLNRHPALAVKFQVQVAKTKNGQEFYFEKFVNIDKLDGYYGNGLRHYANEKQTLEANVFAHSLLVYRYWLTGQSDLLEKHYLLLADCDVSQSVTPFVQGRYWAAALYYAHAFGLPTAPVIEKAYAHYTSISAHRAAASFPRYELYLSEALILTGHPAEALLFVEEAKKHEAEEDDYTHWKFVQNFRLFETVAACRQGDAARAETLFAQIDPSQFYFLRKSFLNILYLHLIGQLKRPNPRHEEQLAALLAETGFRRLQSLF